ncbi:hypothetical protein HK102_007901, partial [Quaeritorhiza haematococci]
MDGASILDISSPPQKSLTGTGMSKNPAGSQSISPLHDKQFVLPSGPAMPVQKAFGPAVESFEGWTAGFGGWVWGGRGPSGGGVDDNGEAKTRFGNAKSISSDQYFGRGAYDEAASAEARERLRSFQGKSGFGSADYYNRDESGGPNSYNSGPGGYARSTGGYTSSGPGGYNSGGGVGPNGDVLAN